MTDNHADLPNPAWEENLLLRTIVKIESLEVYDHFEEDNDYPHYQVSADCSIYMGGEQCMPGEIYISVEPDEGERLEYLKKILQPGAIMWASSKDFAYFPAQERILTLCRPELEPIQEEDLDRYLKDIFASVDHLQAGNSCNSDVMK